MVLIVLPDPHHRNVFHPHALVAHLTSVATWYALSTALPILKWGNYRWTCSKPERCLPSRRDSRCEPAFTPTLE
jgi:hypothetical protein